jgi:gamma-glutamyltranspeptidase/glutathione hydrolase
MAYVLGFAGVATAQRQQSAPEAATGTQTQTLVTARRFMVSAANPHASEAGREILRAGGSAADAAIAVQLVLGLVEPQSSGLGGGAFALHFDKSNGRLTTYDGRETAPAAARPDRFLIDGRAPMPFDTAVTSGLSVGTPGTVRLLDRLHRQHGKLPWADLFKPAIKLARDGFVVSPRLALLLAYEGAARFSPAARAYFFNDAGVPWPSGHVLKNPTYADTLEAVAAGGADAFYTGPIADAVVAAVRGAASPGDLVTADLALYRVFERPALCVTYRLHNVCGMGPPSSGGLAVAQTLKLVEAFDLGQFGRAPQALHVIAEAQKLAFADRDAYVADPDFVPLPAGLLDEVYLGERRRLISHATAMARPAPGRPGIQNRTQYGRDATIENVGTSHISIIDAAGNALSMTTTIEAAFGSRLMAAGFLLNNEMTDFSFRPVDGEGRPIANAIQPGKRPRSSMAPTIVLSPAGDVEAVLGSPGGSRIILYVTKALVALIDWRFDAQAATASPNFGSRGGPFEVEYDRYDSIWTALRMKPFGHRIGADLLTSGTHIVVRRPDGTLEGGADPRREGVARGD